MTKPKPKKKTATKTKPAMKAAARGNGSKPDDESSVPKTHNMGARRDVIRSVCREVVTLEKKRDEINAEIGAVKQKKIKGDLGMKIGDFNAALRVYRLEDDDRDQFLDTMRETFSALGVGKQLDFLKEMEAHDDRPAKDHAVNDPSEMSAPASE